MMDEFVEKVNWKNLKTKIKKKMSQGKQEFNANFWHYLTY